MEDEEAKWWFDGAPGEVITQIAILERDDTFHPPRIVIDPIFETTVGWFYCDETTRHYCGPFSKKETCRKELDKYYGDLYNRSISQS